MVELIGFLILAIPLLIYLIIRVIKKKDYKYYIYIAISFISILIFTIYYLVTKEYSFIIRFVAYFFGIILPAIGLIVVELGYDIREAFILFFVEILLLFKKRKLARKLIFKFLENKPHSFALHKKLGDIFLKDGATRKALNEYIIAINLKQVKSVFLDVAKLYYDLGNIEEAKEGLIYILDKEPEFLDAYMFLAEIYIEKENYKEAARIYNESLKCFKDNLDYNILYKLGVIYAKINDFLASKESFQKAYDIRENDLFLFYIAQMNLIENDIESAVKIFKELLDNPILEAYVFYELAKVAIYRDEKDKAISYVNQAIKIEDSLKDRAMKDHAFSEIKKDFIVTVKLDESEIESVKSKLKSQSEDKELIKKILNEMQYKNNKKSILEKLKLVESKEIELTPEDIELMIHLSNTTTKLTNMNDISVQEKTKEIVDKIFKQKLGQIEVENHILEEQDEMKKENEISSNE